MRIKKAETKHSSRPSLVLSGLILHHAAHKQSYLLNIQAYINTNNKNGQ